MEREPHVPRGRALTAKLWIGAAAGLVSLVLAGVLNFHAVRQARIVRTEMLAAQGVLQTSSELRFHYVQAVGDLRAFFLTGVAEYHDAFEAGIRSLHETLDALQARLGANASQVEALDALAAEIRLRESQFSGALSIYQAGGSTAIAALSTDAQYQNSSTRVRELLERVQQFEQARFRDLELRDERRQDELAMWITGFFALAVVIAVWLSVRLVREWNARDLAERHLRWQQRFADAIIEHLPVMLYIKDAKTLTLIRVNRAVEKMTGRPREDMLHKDDRQFFPPHIAEAYIANERRFVDEYRGEMNEEVPLDTAEGRRILAVRKVVIDDENGKPAYLLGTAFDITERLDSERRLRQFSNELGEKTHALEAANRELESFSYSVSHDLRAPLRAVDGYAAILEEDYAAAFDDEGRRYLRAVREGAARMGQLIQDLLTFSRLGRSELVMLVTPTRQLVEAAWQQVIAGREELTATLEIGELPVSRGDPGLLRQVWANLLENALKYSSKAPTPLVRVAGEIHDGESVFCVEDNGAGFDMKYYDKLFKVFQRLHRDADYPGTGVGLAIVQRIITRHGGRVWADSNPGRGARFSFTLPSA